MQYVPLFIGVLILVLRFLIERKPGARLDVPAARERSPTEIVLSWTGLLLAILVGGELYLTHYEWLTSADAYWLNLLPLAWLGVNFFRKDIPGDRTATNVGIWTLAPYVTYIFSQKELPESLWLSLCLFGWAFFIGIWRDAKRPA
jgi:hypothetical protein